MPRSKLASRNLYDQVVGITYEYFGPAAERFVIRQIEGHLNKSPQDLRKKDLKALIDWIAVATSHLIDDEELVNEYVDKLQKLRKVS